MVSSEPYVLYVEDEPGNRLVFEAAFQDRYAVVMASNAEEALAIMRRGEHRIGLVITDQRMPGIGGNELLRILKDEFPGCIRAILTAFSDIDPILQAINEGLVSRYVIKPWRLEELNDLIAWALDVFRIGEQNSAAQARVLEQERLATLGTVFQAMIHDLNQPLSYFVLNLTQLQSIAEHSADIAAAIDGRRIDIPAKVRSQLVQTMNEVPAIVGDMMGGAEYLQTMMRDAKRFVSSETLNRDNILTDPHHAVAYSLNVCRHHAQQAGVDLRNRVSEYPTKLLVDYSIFCQVVINLVRNAVQAIEGSGKRDGRVTLSSEDKQDHVAFLVEDNGPGMTAEELARLGRGFYTTKKGGSGIGVMQCHRLVGMNGGRFTMESEPGRGTTARIELLRA
ncbi:MAG: hybrid sensor histidine kinase/response regulator [Myxococcota bacterium]